MSEETDWVLELNSILEKELKYPETKRLLLLSLLYLNEGTVKDIVEKAENISKIVGGKQKLSIDRQKYIYMNEISNEFPESIRRIKIGEKRYKYISNLEIFIKEVIKKIEEEKRKKVEEAEKELNNFEKEKNKLLNKIHKYLEKFYKEKYGKEISFYIEEIPSKKIFSIGELLSTIKTLVEGAKNRFWFLGRSASKMDRENIRILKIKKQDHPNFDCCILTSIIPQDWKTKDLINIIKGNLDHEFINFGKRGENYQIRVCVADNKVLLFKYDNTKKIKWAFMIEDDEFADFIIFGLKYIKDNYNKSVQ